MRIATTLFVTTFVAGCAAPGLTVIKDFNHPFDANQAAAMLLPGPNTISGSALMRQQGGGVVTCAGRQVHLIPATDYAGMRMYAIYGTEKFIGPGAGKTFEPDQPAYYLHMKATLCNAQGFFKFDKVADGTFYVQTTVSWVAGRVPQGGNLMERVSVKGGETVEVTLAP